MPELKINVIYITMTIIKLILCGRLKASQYLAPKAIEQAQLNFAHLFVVGAAARYAP